MGDFKGVFEMLVGLTLLVGLTVGSCTTCAVPWAWRRIKPALHEATKP